MNKMEMKKSGRKADDSKVDRYLRPGMSEKEAYNKISKKSDDKREVEKLFEEFRRKRSGIKKVAKKFIESQMAKMASLSPVDYDKYEKSARKTFEKARVKYNLPYEAYLMFLDMLTIKKAQEQGISFTTSKMAKMLGFTDLLKAGKLNVDVEDAKVIAKIKELHAQTLPLFERSVLDSMNYANDDVCKSKILMDILSTYQKNHYNHVHPVLFALFYMTNKKTDIMLQSNFGYIVQCLDKGIPIQTAPDFELYKNLVLDISGVSSSKNPAVDYLNRFELQTILWNEVLCLRSGKVYNNRLDRFLAAIEKYRDNIYDAPNLAFVKDNAAIVRRLFNAFSYRPIQILIEPRGASAINSINPGNLTTALSSQSTGPAIGISNKTNVPIITVKISGTGPINIADSLKGYEWYLNNGMMVQVNQTVTGVNDKDTDLFIVNTDRRESISIQQPFPFSYGKSSVIQYSSGWETMCHAEISDFSTLEINKTISTTLLSVVYHHCKKENIANVNKYYVTGTAAAIVCGTDQPHYKVYNPLGPIHSPTTMNDNNNYISSTKTEFTSDKYDIANVKNVSPVFLVDDIDDKKLYNGNEKGFDLLMKEKIQHASSLLIYKLK